LSDDESTQSK